jgi:hypothetical protein
MKIWIYVEGPGDKNGLDALWDSWREALSQRGHGIRVIPLENKSQFFRKLGSRASEKLCANNEDLVVGLPDLYPYREYDHTKYKHTGLEDLKEVQRREVRTELKNIYGINDANQIMERFFPCALKHDFEMLLLAAKNELKSYIDTPDNLGKWRNPVEDQDHDNPPKYVVEELFRTKSAKRRSYRDTVHAPAILRNVRDIKTVIYDDAGKIQCPVFKGLLDWIGGKTGVAAYQ